MSRGDRGRRAQVPERNWLEKRTVVPTYDPLELAQAVRSASSYARVVDSNVDHPKRARDATRAAEEAAALFAASEAPTVVPQKPSAEALARAMYSSYLESDFPEALVLAEHVIEKDPDHALAQAVISRCRRILGEAKAPSLGPASVLRLRADAPSLEGLSFDARSIVILRHIDGVADAATVAETVGMSRVEALDHLNVLLEVGVLELVG